MTSTGGINSERFIDGDDNRICTSFINILVRNSSMATCLTFAESLITLFEKNVITGLIKNKPKTDEPRYVFEEDTTTGKLFYFGIDIDAQYVKSNN